MFNLARKRTDDMATRRPADLFQNEFNSLVDRFFGNDFLGPRAFSESWPRLEINEKDNEYQVKAEVPGLRQEDIELTLQDNSLIIQGERRTEDEREEEGRKFSEISYGSFYRTIPFTAEVDPERVSASMKDGFLRINVAKSEGSKKRHRKISIA